jgi:hypothetical protein
MYWDWIRADVSAEYEAAMQSFLVRRWGILLHLIAASLFRREYRSIQRLKSIKMSHY